MLHSGQSAASITPGGRSRGLPHPDHAGKGMNLIPLLKAAEQAGDSNRECMHTVMSWELQMCRTPFVDMGLSPHQG